MDERAPSPDATALPIGAAERLVSAPLVLPVVASPIANGAVVLDAKDTVIAVGPRAELVAAYPSAREERAQGVVMPGLVNAHTHLELSALAGRVPGGRGLVAWVGELMAKASALSPEVRRAAALEAARSVRASGTAAVGDVANALDPAAIAIGQAGLAGVLFHELLGSRDVRSGDALADAEAERRGHVDVHGWPEGLAYVPAPHAPYSASPDLLRRIFAAVTKGGRPTSMHVAEDADELELLLHGRGGWAPLLARMGVPREERTPHTTAVPYLDLLGAFAAPRPPLLVHMVHATDEDLALAARHAATAVLCPRSNLHVGGKLADVPKLLRAGVAVALGTDSLASTPDLGLWGEIATLANAFPEVSPGAWLAAATIGGADALALPHLGRIAPGARPGLLDVVPPSLTLSDLVSTPAPEVRWIAQP